MNVLMLTFVGGWRMAAWLFCVVPMFDLPCRFMSPSKGYILCVAGRIVSQQTPILALRWETDHVRTSAPSARSAHSLWMSAANLEAPERFRPLQSVHEWLERTRAARPYKTVPERHFHTKHRGFLGRRGLPVDSKRLAPQVPGSPAHLHRSAAKRT